MLETNKDLTPYFLTPTDITKIRDLGTNVKQQVSGTLSNTNISITKIRIKEIEVLGLISRIEDMAKRKLGEDKGTIRFFDNIWGVGEKLKEQYRNLCLDCACWHLLSGGSIPHIDKIKILDFEGESSILKYLLEQYTYLYNL